MAVQTLLNLLLVVCLLRLDRIILEALWFRISIRVENRAVNRTTSWPETTTTQFMRICIYHDKTTTVWCCWMRRRWTTGKASDG
jgi:hypothetical protein